MNEASNRVFPFIGATHPHSSDCREYHVQTERLPARKHLSTGREAGPEPR